MKLKLSAVAAVTAAALATLAPLAHADVQNAFPDGYVVLSHADRQPIANAQSEWEIRRTFPRGSFRTGDALTPADRAASPANPALVPSFPQSSHYAEAAQPLYAGHATSIAITPAVRPASPAVEFTQPDGYRPVTGSVGAPAIVAAFPQPSFVDSTAATVENASAGAGSDAVSAIVAQFPQPSTVSN